MTIKHQGQGHTAMIFLDFKQDSFLFDVCFSIRLQNHIFKNITKATE